jgi:hypothetical protein
MPDPSCDVTSTDEFQIVTVSIVAFAPSLHRPVPIPEPCGGKGGARCELEISKTPIDEAEAADCSITKPSDDPISISSVVETSPQSVTPVPMTEPSPNCSAENLTSESEIIRTPIEE